MKLRTNGVAITLAACSLVACGDDDGSDPEFEDSGSSATTDDGGVRDAGVIVGLDAGAPTDSGAGSPDAGAADAGRDSGAPVVDSGLRDSGTPPRDSGTPPRDSGTSAADSGSAVADSGTAATDSGSAADSGTAGNDSSVPDIDSSAGGADSGTADPDSTMPGADTGTPPAGGDLPLTAGCLSCANTNCNPNPWSSQNQVTECRDAVCLDIVECAVETNCAVNEAGSIDPGSISRCYCGVVTPQECADNPDYEPNGACLPLFEQGVDTTDKSEVILRLTQDTYPAADAFLLLQCLAEFCMSECGPELLQ